MKTARMVRKIILNLTGITYLTIDLSLLLEIPYYLSVD